METEYSNLRRPKRKLCYLTNKTSPPKKWTEPLTLEDVDKIFDDLDPPSHVKDDLLPSSSLLQTFDTEPNQCGRQVSPLPQDGHLTEQLQRCQMGLKGDSLHPASAPGPKPVIDLDVPFKAHMPVKTSSPIEEKMVVVEELDNEKHHVVSPILFACGDEGEEEAKTEPLLLQEPQCNGHGTEEYLDYVLESPPSKVVFNKPKIPCHQNKVAGLGTETLTVKEKILKKPPASDLEGQQKRRQESTDPRASAVRQEPELAAPKKPSEIDMTTFLKKLRDAVQPKPACSRMTPVKVPTPSAELEDDFLILEDEKPLWFSIPTKTATRKKQREGRTSSSDKDSSTDKGKKESSLETAQKRQESEQTKNTLGSQSVHQKTKKSKGGETKNKIAEPGSDKDGLSGLEELPADDLMFEEQPKEKQGIKNATSKGEEEEQPKDGAGGETNKEKAPLKTEKKAQKSSHMKRPKSSKCENENAKTSRAKSLKGGRRVAHGSDAVKETMSDEAQKQSRSSEEHAEAEDLSSLPDAEGNSEAQTEKDVADEKDKINKLPVASKETSSEAEDVINWKRKRRPVGQWWATQPITEEAKLTDSQPTVKKSKQHNQETVKTKKDGVIQKKNQIQPSGPNPNKSKGRKTKPSKIKNTREDSRPDKEPQHQDQDALSSPLDLSHRDHSSNLGNQVFQKVYHNSSTEKVCTTAASVSPRGRREELRAAESERRRRRKPPGSWWQVGDMCEEAEGVSPRQQRAGPAKERKKVSKRRGRSPRPGTPKNGNAAASPKPQGGAAAPLLATPKTAGPLARVKGFDAAAPRSGAGRRRSGRGAAAPPAQDAAICTVFSDGDLLGLDAVEPQSSHDRSANREAPQDSNFQSENQLKFLRSGPSSMIGLREYEEDEDNLISMADRSPATLPLSDLCAPPLKPLILQPKDKANLTEWFRSLWSVPADKGGEVSPDQFEWYFYQGRAIGFVLDLNCGSFCNGKILLGSYMKKPLWVDHSATTVFNLLTSSVSVTIDGKESCFHPGQSLMVPCGHAYSIQNVTAQPAVLYFTRILAESSD